MLSLLSFDTEGSMNLNVAQYFIFPKTIKPQKRVPQCKTHANMKISTLLSAKFAFLWLQVPILIRLY